MHEYLSCTLSRLSSSEQVAIVRVSGCLPGLHPIHLYWFRSRMSRRALLPERSAALFEEARDRLFRGLGRAGRGWHLLPKRQEPIVGDIVGQLGRLRIVPPQLLAKAIGKTRA